MAMRKLLFFLCAVSLSCFLAFSSMSLDSFADVYYTRVSWSDMASYIGSTVQGYYLSDTDQWKPFTLTRHSANTQYINSVNNSGEGSSLASSSYLVWYYASIPSDIKQGSDTFLPMYQVDWNLHFSGVSYFGCMAGQTNNSVYKTVNITDARMRNYVMAGFYSHDSVLTQASSSNSSVPNSFGVAGGSNGIGGYTGTWIYYDGSAADYYIGTAYYSNSWNVSGGQVFFSLSCPVINPGASFVDHALAPEYTEPPIYEGDGISTGVVSGVISDGTTTQAINVTVETDNSGLIGSLLSGIKNLFVPSDDFLDDFHDDLQSSFEEHLGGVAEAVTLIDEQADYLRAATSANYIYFPELTLPIGSTGYSDGVETIGADYTLIEGRQVELRPARNGSLQVLWDFLEFAVDVVCALAVLNMLQTKFEIFLNPDGEVITYDN